MRWLLCSALLGVVPHLAAQPPPDADSADVSPPSVAPLAPWSPTGTGFEARLKQQAAHIKKQNPTNDARVFNLVVRITAYSGKRSWLRRDLWTDGKVRFAVGKVTGMVDPLNPYPAIKAAEEKARQRVGSPGETDSRRLLDWFINDAGAAYALVGRWLTVEELAEQQSP